MRTRELRSGNSSCSGFMWGTHSQTCQYISHQTTFKIIFRNQEPISLATLNKCISSPYKSTHTARHTQTQSTSTSLSLSRSSREAHCSFSLCCRERRCKIPSVTKFESRKVEHWEENHFKPSKSVGIFISHTATQQLGCKWGVAFYLCALVFSCSCFLVTTHILICSFFECMCVFSVGFSVKISFLPRKYQMNETLFFFPFSLWCRHCACFWDSCKCFFWSAHFPKLSRRSFTFPYNDLDPSYSNCAPIMLFKGHLSYYKLHSK